MRSISNIASFGLICLLVIVASCKKSPSEFNLNSPGLTASIDGTTAQYIIPSGLVNTTANSYTMSGYESATAANTIVLSIDSANTAIDTFGRSGNSLVIVNNGISYSTAANHGAYAGAANVTVNGNKVTGTFSGVLYGSGVNYKDSIVVTNGAISTTY